MILLDRRRELAAVFERHAEQPFRARILRRELGGVLQWIDRCGRILREQRQSQILICGGHLRILWSKRDGLFVFDFRVVGALHGRVDVSEIEVNLGVVGLLCEVILIVLRGGFVVLAIDGALGIAQKAIQRLGPGIGGSVFTGGTAGLRECCVCEECAPKTTEGHADREAWQRLRERCHASQTAHCASSSICGGHARNFPGLKPFHPSAPFRGA